MVFFSSVHVSLERWWCTFHPNPKFLLTSLTNGDVSFKDILFQIPCNAPVASKVILSGDCDVQNGASFLKHSSIRQFPANLRRWKPLERTAHSDRLANGCNITWGTQIMILIRSWMLKKSKETSFKNGFLQIIPRTLPQGTPWYTLILFQIH